MEKDEKFVQWLKIVLYISGGLWLLNEVHSIRVLIENL